MKFSQQYARRRLPLLVAAVVGGALLAAVPALADAPAHTIRPGWGEWWLPYNYAKHGGAIDSMFNFIFWLTTIVLILVQVVLVVFMVKYRHKPSVVKGKFIHGNTRLEMAWTLIPAVILAVLALASKHIWDRYRYAEEYDTQKPTEILVVGEQFQWNVVYPGKDKKFGQYLAFPKPADPPYRAKTYKAAMDEINKVAMVANPLGQAQNWDDPEVEHGKDDDYDRNPGRPIILPVNTPIAVRLSSKDVIHDFFLPNFRVKLDALPGMYGRVNFTAMSDAQSTRQISLSDPDLVAHAKRAAEIDRRKAEREAKKTADPALEIPEIRGTLDDQAYRIWIDAKTPGAIRSDNAEVSQITYSINGRGADGKTPVPVQNAQRLTLETIAALQAARIQEVTAVTKPFELVCEELCGQGHYSMRGELILVSPEQYESFSQKPMVTDDTTKKPGVASATTRPAVVSAAK